ncbi:MAG: SMC family ATPase, partial [bacterium]|nr:SMC family ATPase [bacterium]
MRPLELRIRNFRSYFGEDTVINFRDRGLVGVVGPIGSGKSSLLDAIAFALFGRTPTVAASTKSLIHQRADGATVSLRFSVDDEVWEVTRALRRKGQSVHGLVHLGEDTAEPDKLETHVLETVVNERIVELLGLEFDGFSRSIMLAQGRFAEFLRARPAERDKVLKGVFGYDRVDVMRAEAKIRAASEATRAENLAVRLEAADALAGRIEAGKELAAQDEARLELLRKAEAKFDDYKERLDATARVISHAQTRTGELQPLAARLPVPEVVAEIVRISKSAAETRARLGAVLDKAQSDLAGADAGLVEVDPQATRKRLEEITRLEAIHDQLRGQEMTAAELRASQDDAGADAARRLEKAQLDLESATTAHSEVEAEL